MHITTILILLALVAVFLLAIRWTQVVLGVFGVILLLAGGYLWLNHVQWSEALSTGDLRGLAPHLGTISYIGMGLGVLLVVGSFFIGRLRALRGGVLVLGALVLAGVGYAEYQYGHTLRVFIDRGIIRAVGPEDRTYRADTTENLKALYTAIMLEHESEGQFPEADKWMDALKDRVAAGDLPPAEAMKKFKDPGADGESGYALNDAVATKYVDDVPDPEKTLLIFVSSDTSWNAHGEPKELLPNPPRGEANYGVTVSGDLVEISSDGSLKVLEKLADQNVP